MARDIRKTLGPSDVVTPECGAVDEHTMGYFLPGSTFAGVTIQPEWKSFVRPSMLSALPSLNASLLVVRSWPISRAPRQKLLVGVVATKSAADLAVTRQRKVGKFPNA